MAKQTEESWVEKHNRTFKQTNPWEWRWIQATVWLEFKLEYIRDWIRDEPYWVEPLNPEKGLRGLRTGRVVEWDPDQEEER